ncbi:unnamed protein product [Phyllotreta striolata]|uniref:Uncharacterized protein n=1 Tax=Phyllotreta striolata TaxID=444603 RepID=A0A9N9TLE5_PHYSR|nr:unnamed protein product [Phyllotreta striolata]
MDDLTKVPEVTCEHPDFRYIFAVQGAPKLCFGSTAPRNTNLTGAGLLSHQRMTALEDHGPDLSPNKYDLERFTSSMWPILNKIRSVYGIPGLDDRVERWPDDEKAFRTPSPVQYAPSFFRKDHRQDARPFKTGSPARLLKINPYPGPGFYDLLGTRRCRRVPKQFDFGRPRVLPCMEMVCVATPQHVCQFCRKLCEGDYWHRNKEVFLCQVCWYIERSTNEYLSLVDLKRYTKMRNCSFMHRHENTEAAVRVMTSNEIRKKFKIENYLSLYISCYD